MDQNEPYGFNIIKFISTPLSPIHNKLECLLPGKFLTVIFDKVEMFQW